MPFLNKEKLLNGFGKAVDATNRAADKVQNFVKEKEIDKKFNNAVDKMDNFVKEKGIDTKIEAAADKVSGFVKDNELDKKASNMVHSMGNGIKKAGEKIEETFSSKPNGQ